MKIFACQKKYTKKIQEFNTQSIPKATQVDKMQQTLKYKKSQSYFGLPNKPLR